MTLEGFNVEIENTLTDNLWNVEKSGIDESKAREESGV